MKAAKTQTSDAPASGDTTGRPFIMTRIFNAPRERVWKAWTEPERFQRWFGPKDCTVTDLKMEARPGGICHCCIRPPNGQEMWGKFMYREILESERLVYIQHFSDRAGGITRHPMSPTWPLHMLTTVTLMEQIGGTALTVRWEPLGSTDEELKTFDSAHEGMNQGWGGSFDQLAGYLAG